MALFGISLEFLFGKSPDQKVLDQAREAQFALDYLDQIDIGMLAPSRAGKSTLITAMCEAFSKRLAATQLATFTESSEDNIYEFPNKYATPEEQRTLTVSTADHMKQLRREYSKATTGSGKFSASTRGDRDAKLLTFTLGNNKAEMEYRILDYPGGAVSQGGWMNQATDVPTDMLTAADKVLKAYTEDCFALIIPVFALAVEELYILDQKHEQNEIDDDNYNKRSSALHQVLDMHDIVPRVVEWCLSRVRAKKNGILLISPVKCEKYFASNDRVQRAMLQEHVKELVFDNIINRLKSNCEFVPDKQNLFNSIRELIRVEYLPVQTFGTQMFKDAKLEWRDYIDQDGEPAAMFSDKYTRRGAGAMPNPVGVEGIIYEVLRWRNALIETMSKLVAQGGQEQIASQGTFTRLFANLNGRNDRIRAKISRSRENAAKSAELVKDIAHLDINLRHLSGWSWDFSSDMEDQIEL